MEHNYSKRDIRIWDQGTTEKDIIIGNDIWIGTKVCILHGVTIGGGAVVGAGSVVTKNVDPYTVVGGVPARFIKDRDG